MGKVQLLKFIVLLLLLICSRVSAHPHPEEPEAQRYPKKESVDSPVRIWDSWVINDPFVPTRRDYTIEFGSAWERDNLYWVGVGFGFNLGTCVFSDSQTCQQYWDITSGGAARDSETHGLWFSSLRWQFVNFPDTFSPMARVFFGGDLLNISGKGVSYHHIGGIGIGVTQYLSDRSDVRIEYRLGRGKQIFSQVVFGVHIKIDSLVTYFGDKLKGFGLETYEAGEKVLEDTGEVISKPFNGSETEPSKNENK